MSGVQLGAAKQPHVLTIAGSDSGGGAGIQADLKTFAALGCYGSSVITGLTAQNTMGVHGVHVIPADFVLQQLKAVFDDEPPACLKIGMLTSPETILRLSEYLSTVPSRPLTILDPVMISTSGHTLLPEEAIDNITISLLPHVDWVTPNIPEALRLVNSTQTVESLSDLIALAKQLRAKIPTGQILLKGGHLAVKRSELDAAEGVIKYWEEGDDEEETVEVLALYRDHVQAQQPKDAVVDILMMSSSFALFIGNRLESGSTHGTGCTLSSAIAAFSALPGGTNPLVSASNAIKYTRSAISTAFKFGQGHGPLNHSHVNLIRGIPPPTEHNPHPFTSHLVYSDTALWTSYVKHDFVVQLGEGRLPRECFEHYIKQDYHYLRHYARAHALGAYKSSQFADIKAFTDIAAHIAKESANHVKYCEEYGIDLGTLIAEPEAEPCSAYARYILDVGNQGDVLDLYMAVASCLIGYGEVGLWLKRKVDKGVYKLEGNPYRRWIETYCGEEFLGAIRVGIDNLETRIAADPPSPEKLKKLTKIWHDCVTLERNFWDMGLKLIK